VGRGGREGGDRGRVRRQPGVAKIISAKLDKKLLEGIFYWNTTFYVPHFRLILPERSS
jgi:hypothetical protein